MNLLTHKSVVDVLVACAIVLCSASAVHAVTIENSVEATANTGGQTSVNGADGTDGEDGSDGRDGRDGTSGTNSSNVQNGSASASVHIESYVNGEEVTNISQTEQSESGESVSASAEISHTDSETSTEHTTEVSQTSEADVRQDADVSQIIDIENNLQQITSSSFLFDLPMSTGSLATFTAATTETDAGLKNLFTTIRVTLFSYVEKFF